MISWIVASHDPEILADVLMPALYRVEGLGDQLVIVRNAESIAKAYRLGQRQATEPIRVFIHHDVRILDLGALRWALGVHCRDDVGVVGVIGSRTETLPWWEGERCGRVRDARLGLLDFGPGGPAAVLDGLLLATRHELHWDETYPGWHLYDHDVCRQMVALGLTNWCLDDGHRLVEHVTTGPTNTARLVGWAEGVDRYRRKWEPMTTSPEQDEPETPAATPVEPAPPLMAAMHVTATAVVTRPDGSTDEEDSL